MISPWVWDGGLLTKYDGIGTNSLPVLHMQPYQWDGNGWTTTDPSSNFPGSDSWHYDPDTGAPFNWTGHTAGDDVQYRSNVDGQRYLAETAIDSDAEVLLRPDGQTTDVSGFTLDDGDVTTGGTLDARIFAYAPRDDAFDNLDTNGNHEQLIDDALVWLTGTGGGGSGGGSSPAIHNATITIDAIAANAARIAARALPMQGGGGSGTETVTYTYDTNGIRTTADDGTNTTHYGGQWYEITNGTHTNHYHANGRQVAQRQAGSTTQYRFTDHLGSTLAVSDTAGNHQTQRYSPFGATRGTSSTNPPTDLGYTGQRADSTGLSYYNARYYDPLIGRFTQPDTIVPDLANPQALNRYTYVIKQPCQVRRPERALLRAVRRRCNGTVRQCVCRR